MPDKKTTSADTAEAIGRTRPGKSHAAPGRRSARPEDRRTDAIRQHADRRTRKLAEGSKRIAYDKAPLDVLILDEGDDFARPEVEFVVDLDTFLVLEAYVHLDRLP